MRINFVKIEETLDWVESIQKVAGKLYGVYAYNPRVVTHCCEITPSYECIRVDTVTENFVDDDTFGDILQWQGDGEVSYFHTSFIDSIKKPNKRSITGFETMDDAEEYARGNAIF